MAIKRRKLPGSLLTEKVGSCWRDALEHPLITDTIRLEDVQYSSATLEHHIALLDKAPASTIDCKLVELALTYAIICIVYHEHGERLISDAKYRRLDKMIFMEHAMDVSMGPVARDMVTDGLHRMRKDAGHKHAKFMRRGSYVIGRSIYVDRRKRQALWRAAPTKKIKLRKLRTTKSG